MSFFISQTLNIKQIKDYTYTLNTERLYLINTEYLLLLYKVDWTLIGASFIFYLFPAYFFSKCVITVMKGISYLVSVKGLNEACIDVVDGDAENHNNHILSHSFREGVSILYNHGHIGR